MEIVEYLRQREIIGDNDKDLQIGFTDGSTEKLTEIIEGYLKVKYKSIIKSEEYFNEEYDEGYINLVVEMGDTVSIFGLMDEYVEAMFNNVVKTRGN